MSDQSDETDKSFDATPQKLLEARRKGDIARSTDLLTASAYAGLLIAFLAVGASVMGESGTTLMILIDQSGNLAPLMFDGRDPALFGGLMQRLAIALSPLFILPTLAVLAALFAQRALVFAPDKIKPKLSRISLISNAKNKFGRSGLFEFGKSFAKLCIYSICLALFIRAHLPEMLGALQTDPRLVLALLAELCVTFLFVVVLISGLIGLGDALWQHFEHLRKNRMSLKEIKDETKDAEGDPHLKQERRQRALLTAQNQMMKEVPAADVVIVNPTHYAVVLKWSRLPGEAPVCVAKGVDEIAHSIRELAETHQVPIHSDPPTARALYATTDIGDQVPPDHYEAVAAAIRFSESMRLRAKGRV